MTKLKEKLKNDILLVAEGYLFELEKRGYMKAGAFVPDVVLDNPAAVEMLHREYADCGSDVMVALTYYAYKHKGDLELLNKQAIRIAKKVAQEKDLLTAGNICNTWLYDPKNEKSSLEKIEGIFDKQVRWAKEEEVDYIIAETINNLPEALTALKVIKKYDLPAAITLATDDLNEDWAAHAKVLEKEGADIVGLNCSSGPRQIFPKIENILKNISVPVAALPVAYDTEFFGNEPGFPISLEKIKETRETMAEFAQKAKNAGVKYIGGCCGTAPYHIRAMAEALDRQKTKYSSDLSEHPVLGGDAERWG